MHQRATTPIEQAEMSQQRLKYTAQTLCLLRVVCDIICCIVIGTSVLLSNGKCKSFLFLTMFSALFGLWGANILYLWVQKEQNGEYQNLWYNIMWKLLQWKSWSTFVFVISILLEGGQAMEFPCHDFVSFFLFVKNIFGILIQLKYAHWWLGFYYGNHHVTNWHAKIRSFNISGVGQPSISA